ncbi:MAG: methyl-accepting chemotaxis protein [Pseudomonadota bacterium]
MIRLSNIRIGTKLAAASAIGILLVAGMTASQILNNRSVSDALDAANRQKTLLTAAYDFKASARGLFMGVRDIRLATTQAHINAAQDMVKERREGMDKALNTMVELTTNPASRDRLQQARADTDTYIGLGNEIIKLKNQIFPLQPRTPNAEISDAAIAKIASLTADAEKIGRERTAPLAQAMNKMVDEIGEEARKSAEAADQEAQRVTTNAERLGMVLSGLTIVMLIGTAIFGSLSIARPLRALVKPIEDLSNGNFAVTVKADGRKDEVGQIAEAVRAMADKVRSTISEVKSSAREVTNASMEISTATTDLSQRTEEQAASLEETSASMEEIAATVKKNAENAQQANASAAQTQQVADRGGAVVAKAVGAMAKIEESSRKISDIIGVIDEIARQTNLLALNAAVEAARAGEAGRGFAVVASEVRSLAQRSSQAAKDIKDLITNSNSQVKDGVDLVNQAGTALNEIVESIKTVASIVSDIANASIEQSTGIEQVNRALTQMDEVTQQNSALVEENAATAKTLEHQAKSMDEQVAFFQIDMAAGAEGMTHAKVVTAKPVVAKAVAVEARAEAKPIVMPKAQAAAPRRAPRVAAAGGARGMQAQLATAIHDDPEWKEF